MHRKQVPGFERKIDDHEHRLILPLVLRYLTPLWAAVFGLGAVSGAVMASADSAILASSALIARNVYKHIFRPNAKDKEVVIFLRCMICVVTICACALALSMESVYHLAFMCADMVFVCLLPQLTICLYFSDYTNVYGSCFAYIFGLTMRILAGEPKFGFDPIIKYPLFDYKRKSQGFPYRTFLMLLSCGLFFLVSYIAEFIFIKKQWLGSKSDFLYGFPELHIVEITPKESRVQLRIPSQAPPTASKFRVILEH